MYSKDITVIMLCDFYPVRLFFYSHFSPNVNNFKCYQEKKTDEELLIDHINTAYQCLDDFMKTQDEVKIKDCMTLLSEIKTLAGKTVDSLKVFTAVQKDTEKVTGNNFL